MARVAYVCASEVAASSKLPKRFRGQLKKISLACAFASDSSYGVVGLGAGIQCGGMAQPMDEGMGGGLRFFVQ